MLTSGRVLPALFGDEYRAATSLLVLVAARLPVLLVATWLGSALVAIGREREALGVTVVAGLIALVAVPLAAVGFGTVGIGAAVLGVEGIAAVGGWVALRRLGIEPGRSVAWGRVVAGCVGLVAGVAVARDAPLVVTCFAGVVGYVVGWIGAGALGPPHSTRSAFWCPPHLWGMVRVGGSRGNGWADAGPFTPAIADVLPCSPPTLPSPARGEREDPATGKHGMESPVNLREERGLPSPSEGRASPSPRGGGCP